MKEKGSYGGTFKLFEEKYSGELLDSKEFFVWISDICCLLKKFCSFCHRDVHLTWLMFSFFWHYISIAYWRFNPIFFQNFQQLFCTDLYLLNIRVVASKNLRPKLIGNVSLASCTDNPVLVDLHVCTGLESKGRKNNIEILCSYYLLIQMLHCCLL